MEPKIKQTKKGSKAKSCLALILFVLVLLIILAILAFSWYNNAIYPTGQSSATVDLTVNQGETLNSIAQTLEEKGLIQSKDALRIYLRLNQVDPNIKAGNYSIAKNLNVPELINILEKGVLKADIKVTIKEGLRQDQTGSVISDAMGSSAKFTLAEFTSIVESPDKVTFSSDIQTFLNKYKPAGKTLEGFLYPDTYEFSPDQTTQEIVEKMLTNFINKINSAIDLNNLNLKQSQVTTLFQAITLASIIEKEASKTDDRKEISGIFNNRLKDNFLLESDATVNYISGKNDPGVKDSDRAIDSPYNTYKYTGLPPGPINNPRIESIVAAFYPNATDNYYFFHDDNGNVYYSKTFAEHQQKVCQIRGC